VSVAPESAAPGAGRLRLSVALCTYNGSVYLDEQLQSIVNQSRLPDEVVICDDGSTDRTVDIARQFATAAQFAVRVSVNESNLGSTKNFEKAIRLCEGDVIVLSDQDDCWYETRLSTLERFFLSNPSVGLVFSDADLMDENSRPLGKRLWKTFGLSESRSKQIQEGRALDVLLRHNVVYGSTMAFRSELRDIVLPIPDITTHDLWISLIVSVLSEIRVLPVPLIKYRKHSAQQRGVLYYGLRESVEKARQIGAAEFRSHAAQYAMARDRIQQRRSGRDLKSQIDLLDGKIRHMSMRAAIPAARWKRLPMILRQTVNGDYFRYSEGYKSIAKDLVL
jgi:glycosyltransferase involved in cell wall biosynthesis